MIPFRLVLALVVGSWFPSAKAQSTFDGCRDIDDNPVVTMMHPYVQRLAMAVIADNGQPVIAINPNLLEGLSDETRLFFFTHECARLALGPLERPKTPERIKEADCWAVRTLVNGGLFTVYEAGMVEKEARKLDRMDWIHIEGPKRPLRLQACLAEGAR